MVLTGPGFDSVFINEARLSDLTGQADNTPSEPVDVADGWLHAIDVAPDEIRVRDAGGQDWVCSYDPALEATMRGLLDTQVRVMGAGRRNGRRATFEVVKVETLAPAAGVLADRGRSAEKVLDEALAAAHISGPQPLSALRRDVDPSDPEEVAFIEALRAFA